MSVFHVVARRWTYGWELTVRDQSGLIGVTQSRTLSSAESMVRDYVALSEDIEPDSFDVDISVELGGELQDEAEKASGAVRAAEQAQRDAAARSRQFARRLKESGLSGADIAVVLKVSAQRVSQLLNPRASRA